MTDAASRDPSGKPPLLDGWSLRETLVEERRLWLQRLSRAPDDVYLRRRLEETQRLIDLTDRVIEDEAAASGDAASGPGESAAARAKRRPGWSG